MKKSSIDTAHLLDSYGQDIKENQSRVNNLMLKIETPSGKAEDLSQLSKKTGHLEEMVNRFNGSLISIQEKHSQAMKDLEHQITLTLDRVAKSFLEDNRCFMQRVSLR